MEFVRRPASESPILQRMLDDATTDEDVAKAMAYGAKVDAFNRTGEVTVTVLEYEGPDLSPGAERENTMRGVKSRVYQPMYDSDGNRIPGRKTAVIPGGWGPGNE